MMGKIRVLVTGEETLVREALASLLKTCEDIDIIGEAADGKETIDRVHDLQPDVVLMDITMKDMNGLEVTRHLTRQAAETKVVILTDRETMDSVAGTFLAGAHGCIPMAASSADLASAVRAVQAGDMYLHPSLTKTLIHAYVALRKIEAHEDPYEQLTDREKHVLRLLAEGRTSRQVAQELGIAVKTAAGHKANAMKKLGIHNRAELIKYAVQRGIVHWKLQ